MKQLAYFLILYLFEIIIALFWSIHFPNKSLVEENPHTREKNDICIQLDLQSSFHNFAFQKFMKFSLFLLWQDKCTS